MTVQIHDPAMPHLEDEIAFSIRDEEGDGVNIHPWDRPGSTYPREVAIVVGSLTGFEAKEGDHSDEYDIAIVDRAEFIDGLLAVFPELARADASVPR